MDEVTVGRPTTVIKRINSSLGLHTEIILSRITHAILLDPKLRDSMRNSHSQLCWGLHTDPLRLKWKPTPMIRQSFPGQRRGVAEVGEMDPVNRVKRSSGECN